MRDTTEDPTKMPGRGLSRYLVAGLVVASLFGLLAPDWLCRSWVERDDLIDAAIRYLVDTRPAYYAGPARDGMVRFEVFPYDSIEAFHTINPTCCWVEDRGVLGHGPLIDGLRDIWAVEPVHLVEVWFRTRQYQQDPLGRFAYQQICIRLYSCGARAEMTACD